MIITNVINNYEKINLKFIEGREQDSGYKIMMKLEKLVIDIGKNFNNYDGGTLSEYQSKIAGYKFFLADYVASLERVSEELKLEVKYVKAKRWADVTEEIKLRDGKVKNKEQIENILLEETYDLQNTQILYETLYFQFKLKISAINDILTLIVQKISFLKQEIKQTNQ